MTFLFCLPFPVTVTKPLGILAAFWAQELIPCPTSSLFPAPLLRGVDAFPLRSPRALRLTAEQEQHEVWAARRDGHGPPCLLSPAHSPGSQWQPPVRFHGSRKINADEAAEEEEETSVALGLMTPPPSPWLTWGASLITSCAKPMTGRALAPKSRSSQAAPADGR